MRQRLGGGRTSALPGLRAPGPVAGLPAATAGLPAASAGGRPSCPRHGLVTPGADSGSLGTSWGLHRSTIRAATRNRALAANQSHATASLAGQVFSTFENHARDGRDRLMRALDRPFWPSWNLLDTAK